MSDPIGPLRPIITGTPASTVQNTKQTADGQSFGDMLRQSITAQSTRTGQPLTLSKHAMQRAEQRDIALSNEDLQRLDQAVDIARDRGLTDTLVFLNNTAFIVNVPNRTVVTMMEGGETDQTVITNIDGAVLL